MYKAQIKVSKHAAENVIKEGKKRDPFLIKAIFACNNHNSITAAELIGLRLAEVT
jgi:hypothetical protein